MKRNRRTLLIIGAILTVLLVGAAIVNAAPSNTRGRVAVDIENFTYVSHSGGRSRGLSKEDNGYKLYYENYLFSNHDNDGVTYRSKKTFDMTDVDRLEFSAYVNSSSSDKFMIYTTSSSDKTYHGKDREDIKDSMYNGESPAVNGRVYSFSNFYTPSYANNYCYTRFSTDDTYDSRYVYIAMSKAIEWAKTGIMLQNNTYSQKADGTPVSGGINLMLKEHKVTLLAPEKPKQIDKDNKEVTNTAAYSDLEIKLNDGEAYGPNQTGSVYRDEEIVLAYKWGAGVTGQVAGYNFYADKEKKTKIYQLNTSSGKIDFDADLIRTIEKSYGRDLGNFYLEPIFKYQEVTVDVSETVAETDSIEITEVSGGAKDYVVIDKETQQTIGTIKLNNAKYVGDYLRIDYEKNQDYTGDYTVDSFLLALCETKDQVDSTTNTASFYPSDTAVDYNERVEHKYIRILPRTKLSAKVTLNDKTVIFCNKKVEIDPAIVTYPEDAMSPPGINKIDYQYYSDASCKEPLSDAPINVGIYYVVATMPGDADYYAEAVSEPAKLTIQKAVPVLEKIYGKEAITYGQDLTKTNGVNGTAKGVDGNTITGTFAWVNPSQKLNAGYRKASVQFTPTGLYANNYTVAEGNGLAVVKADSVDVTVGDIEHVYDGHTPPTNGVTVKGKISQEETGQEVELSYYKDAQYLSEPPVFAGEYFVEANVYNEGNFNGGSGEGKVTIERAKAELFMIPPVKDQENGNYRVYMQGPSAEPQAKPQGQIQLTASYGGETKEESAFLKQGPKGQYYAEFDLSGIRQGVFVDTEIKLTAKYVNDNDNKQDYIVEPVEQTIYKDTLAQIASLEFTYRDGKTQQPHWQKQFFDEEELKGGSILLDWQEIDINDVASVTLPEDDDLDGELSVTAKNAGNAYILAIYSKMDGGSKKTQFIMYEITVAKAAVDVTIEPKTAVYDGNPVTIDTAQVAGNGIEGERLPTPMRIKCDYYTDADCQQALEGLPTQPGTYYVVATTTETRNYLEGTSKLETITIEKATAELSLQSKMAIYDGQPHQLDEAIATGTVYKTDKGVYNQDVEPAEAEPEPVTGTITYTYTDKEGNPVKRPVDAGTYTVTAKLTEDPIYQDTQTTAVLVIIPAHAKLHIENVEKVYDGLPAEPAVSFQVNGQEIDVPEEVYTEYGLKILAGRRVAEGLPTQAGNYYSRASIDQGNYWSAYSELGEIIIYRAPVDVVIPHGYEEEYNGSPVNMDNAIVRFNGEDVTKDFTISYEYYSDRDCTKVIEAPQYPGTYYVKAFTKGQRNFEPGESEPQTILIQKRPVFLSELKINSAEDVTGKAVNKEGVEVAGTFHIVDTEAFWQLPAGTHQVEVEFVPDTEAARIYYGETGFALYTVEPEKDQDDDGDHPTDGERPNGKDDPDDNNDQDGDSDSADGDNNDQNGDSDSADGGNDGVNGDDKAANTGDHNPMAAYLILVAAASATIAVLRKKKNIDRIER